MKNYYRTVIIGSGCAGFNAAERLYDLGEHDIVILTEGREMGTSRNTGSDKQTYYKLSLCGGDPDSVLDMANTLFEGGGVNGDTALIEAAYSTRCFYRLVELGVPFPTNEYGEYVGYKTDHDPRSRATSCGPLTSKLMTEALEKSVMLKNIELADGYQVIKIITKDESVCGVAALCNGEITVIGCENVILATGGPAGIYLNSVYPESQTGGTGLALDAGAHGANLEEWQYGLASVKFRWNVSGTYQQVLPRYISIDETGTEHEFLSDALGKEADDMVFLKGYQWPFDTRKIGGSSRVDILVNNEIQQGRRVYMDFTRNPKGLENGFGMLSKEANTYLEKSGALSGTPIERLALMNEKAIRLYRDNGIDLYREPLEVAVCAQHCNGGIAVDENWESNIKGLYTVGEAAGTFGVYRPGGSALNSTQVGSLRAAEHIAKKPKRNEKAVPGYKVQKIKYGVSNIKELLSELKNGMSECAAFDRDIPKMKRLYEKLCGQKEFFFESATIKDSSELPVLFKLYDLTVTAKAVLSAELFSAESYGPHGSAMVRGVDSRDSTARKDNITVTDDEKSYAVPVRPIPVSDIWFESVWKKYNKNGGNK